MKKISLLFCILIVISQIVSAQRIWSSAHGTATFTKQAFSDWKQAPNQDRISDSVWITRANTQSIFNIRKDTAYATNAPSGTLWAFGKTDSFATLTYKTFVSLSGGSPQSLVGKDLVLHLVAENIYLDVKFLTYGGGNGGGGFSYIRAASILGNAWESFIFPAAFELKQNYPNPFNPSTMIDYQLPMNNFVSLKIYDAIGREVAILVNEEKEAGYYSVTFDGSTLSSGIYFARLTSSGKTQIRKLSLIK